MRIAFCHNLKTDDSLAEAEFDTPETAARIVEALAAGGHEVHGVDVSGPVSLWTARLEALRPDLVFNTAEGRRGKMREAFFPSLFEHLGIPFTGAGGYGCALTLDKRLTKSQMAAAGVPVLPDVLIAPGDLAGPERGRLLAELAALPPPLLSKPNFEGSGKGVSEKSVFEDLKDLEAALPDLLRLFPEGMLVEPFVAGRDATVGFLEALSPPVLEPTGYRFDPGHANRFNVYGYYLKNQAPEDAVEVVVPLELPARLKEDLMRWTEIGARALWLADLGRLDYRIAPDGRAFFLEANALPSLEHGAGFLRAAERRGLDYAGTIGKVVESACRRWGLDPSRPASPRRDRVALIFNLKRTDTHADDAEAEFDSPRTIAALRKTLEELGNEVVELEAQKELPVRLSASGADLVFNIAEGAGGRNRESLVPALCELLGLSSTGSDPATLSIALDKTLGKRLLREAGVPTPPFQLFHRADEELRADLRFPLIAKPNEEGTSKGLGPDSVVDGEPALRALVARLLGRYRQPVIVEEYVEGREFTVGLLGWPRPRALPPMEVVFHRSGRPVYVYADKQDFSDDVSYVCPAPVTPEESRRLSAAALGAFEALGCRDVARVDLRLDRHGVAQVIEVNPLPGLTPGFSDLCLIADGVGLSYKDLVGEILAAARARRRLLDPPRQ